MARLTVSVLGDLQVSIDDLPVSSFESERSRALLAYLVVEAARPHRRDKLVGLLWPDWPEQAARHNLRQALFNLRLVLGDHTARPPYLLITRDAIQFNRTSDHWLDLDHFNAGIEAWVRKPNAEQAEGAGSITQLEETVRLYRGEFLQHFSLADSAELEDWILIQREAVHQKVITALACLTDEHEKRADFHTASRFARRQLELDPWREEAHMQLMRLLALDGQRSAALAQYEGCKKVLAEELGAEPSPKTRECYELIRSGRLLARQEPPLPDPSTPIQNLPVPLTPFIGREEELAGLGRLIADPECRCITLVGPGGIGKTRLALQAASQHQNEFAQGCAFIPLASVGSLDGVIPAIANGIGFAFYGPSDPKNQLLRFLQPKQMLVVVDNVEHLLVEGGQQNSIAGILVEILQAAGQVKLLVTSREALNLQGEWPFEVHGLSFPESESEGGNERYSALALFVQRAQRARPGFEMSPEDRKEVVRICRLVEGMPLAIELAATWVRILSPAEIATEIEASLDILNVQVRDLPERHRSMRAVFDHSWQMLPADEKLVLSRLSVFRGGFGRQAAERVAGASLPVLSSLVIRSLLRHTATGRYDLHELVRQYCAAKLAEDPAEQHRVQAQHSQYYLGLLETRKPDLFGQNQLQAKSELTGEMDNLRAAWNRAVTDRNTLILYRVSFTMVYLLTLHDWFKEGEVTFLRTVEAIQAALADGGTEDPGQQVAYHAMLAHYGYCLFRQGRTEEAYAILAPSAAFLRAQSDPAAICYSHWYKGVFCWVLGRFPEARESLQVSLESARNHGERWHEVLAVEFLGRIAHEQGDYAQALPYFREALALIRQLGDTSMTAHVLSYYGRLLESLGDYRQAEATFQEALELARKINYRFAIGLALDGLGKVASAQGKYAAAQEFFSGSASLFREAGDHRLSRTLNHQGFNSLAMGDLAQAQKSFCESLSMSHQGGLTTIALYALAGLAAVDLRQKASRNTLEIVAAILQHPSSSEETKSLARRLRAELEARLAAEEIEAARQHASTQSLDEMIRLTLASF